MAKILNFIGCALLLYVGIVAVGALPHPPTTAAPLLAADKFRYDTKFDNVDLDEILGQERLLKNYVKCLEGAGPCTPDGKMLKETLPDAISTDCSKCSAKQKYGSQKVTRFLIDNQPDDWARLEKIYDPQGTYRLSYLADKAAQSQESTTTTKA